MNKIHFYNYLYITDSCIQELELFNEVRPKFKYGLYRTDKDGINTRGETRKNLNKPSRIFNTIFECDNHKEHCDMEKYILEKLHNDYKFIKNDIRDSEFFFSDTKCFNMTDMINKWKEVTGKINHYQWEYRSKLSQCNTEENDEDEDSDIIMGILEENDEDEETDLNEEKQPQKMELNSFYFDTKKYTLTGSKIEVTFDGKIYNSYKQLEYSIIKKYYTDTGSMKKMSCYYDKERHETRKMENKNSECIIEDKIYSYWKGSEKIGKCIKSFLTNNNIKEEDIFQNLKITLK
jgi:hypothetical protein